MVSFAGAKMCYVSIAHVLAVGAVPGSDGIVRRVYCAFPSLPGMPLMAHGRGCAHEMLHMQYLPPYSYRLPGPQCKAQIRGQSSLVVSAAGPCVHCRRHVFPPLNSLSCHVALHGWRSNEAISKVFLLLVADWNPGHLIPT